MSNQRAIWYMYLGTHSAHAWIQRGTGGPGSPLKNHKNRGCISNTGPDPLKSHKATKPAFNVEQSLARQGKWRFAGRPMIAHF